jgi:hypothetical protein
MTVIAVRTSDPTILQVLLFVTGFIWLGIRNTVMKLRVPKNAGKF